MLNKNITVCIPVYNAEKTVKSAIQSVLNAKLKKFELLLSDNASTDNTKNICLKFKQKFPHLITYSRNLKNIGFAENYKKCIRLARGKYIFFIGADDILLPKSIDFLISDLNKHSDKIISCSDIFTFDVDPRRMEKKFIFFAGKKKSFKKGSDSLVNWLFHSAIGSIGGYLMRSAEAKKIACLIPSSSYVPQVHLAAYMSVNSGIIHRPIFSLLFQALKIII